MHGSPEKQQPAPPPEGPPFALNVAIQSLLDAEQLSKTQGSSISALLLTRATLRQLILATLLDRGETTSATPELEVWDIARRVFSMSAPGPGSEQQAFFADWFERFIVPSTGDLSLAEVPVSDQARLLRSMLDRARDLATPLDRAANDPVRIARKWRRLRISAVILLGLTSAFGLRCALAPVNLALNKAVTVADADPSAPPAGLVDGDQLNVGFHSGPRPNPTATIDLGGVHRISRIEVFNRPDCCQDRAVPLNVETSIDGKKYVSVKKVKHTFYHLTVRLPAPTAVRYVRLARGGSDVFHLSEVEIY